MSGGFRSHHASRNLCPTYACMYFSVAFYGHFLLGKRNTFFKRLGFFLFFTEGVFIFCKFKFRSFRRVCEYGRKWCQHNLERIIFEVTTWDMIQKWEGMGYVSLSQRFN